MKKIFAAVILALSLVSVANAQLIYGNTFPFWNVKGPLTVTGTSTLSGGTVITGTVTNDAATAGTIGELLTSTVPVASVVAGAATNTEKNLTSLALTAGDWDVTADCDFIGSSLIATVLRCGLGTTTATLLTQAGGGGVGTDPITVITGASQTFPDTVVQLKVGPVRVSIAATTTIYLVGNNTFSGGSYGMYGTLRARRMR